MEKLTKIQAIKKYFGSEGYPEVTTKEILAMRNDLDSYRELAYGAAKQLGAEIVETVKS